MYGSCFGDSSSRGYSPVVPEIEDEETHPVEGVASNLATLIPLEIRCKAKFTSKDERILRHNYDILASVQIHFKDPDLGTFSNGEIFLFEIEDASGWPSSSFSSYSLGLAMLSSGSSEPNHA